MACAPIFIIGSPRSGTTMLRLMLNAHPEVVIPPECGFLVWLHGRFGEWGMAEFGDATRRREFSEAVAATRKFDTWGISAAELQDALSRTPIAGYPDACAAVYRLYAELNGAAAKRVWGDKNNFYLHHVPLLADLYPGARFVHIHRDGRDVACSYREVMSAGSQSRYRPNLPVDIAGIAEAWSGDIRTIAAAISALGGRARSLAYESLVLHPERELDALCEWLGLRFDPAMLEFHRQDRPGGREPAETLDWKARTLTPVSAGTIGRYRHMLSPDEQEQFMAIARNELVSLGYAAAGASA